MKTTARILSIIVLILTGCQSTWRQPFPDAEIVYQGDNLVETADGSEYYIGFVDSDGSNSVKIKTGMLFHVLPFGDYLIKPVWGVDSAQIFALEYGTIQDVMGFAAYWEQGRVLKYCKNWYLPEQIQGLGSGKALINLNRKKVLIVDLAKCKEDRTLVDYSNDNPFALEINGISYSLNHDMLLFGLVNESLGTYDLMSLDVKTGETNVLGQGLNPTWSPDGAQIAYVQTDGIYVMNKDGTEARKVITQNIPFDERFWNASSAPIPRWSPDGEWLVYDRCSNGEYICSIAESSIYKVEVASGKEVKIVDGGIFPDWKK